MYDHVRKPSRRRDGMLLVWILTAVFLLIALAAPVAWGMHLQLEYREFVNDLTESVLYGKAHASIYTHAEGGKSLVSANNASRLYDLILTAGAGKPQKALPAGESLLLEFGDGSSLRFWPVEIEKTDPGDSDGTFVLYTDPTGGTYAYDTELLSYDALSVCVSPAKNSP